MPTATRYLEVDPGLAPSLSNEAETKSAGFADPAFAYAFAQNKGLLPPAWEGDQATLDALFALAKGYKTPPATPTLTTLAPNTKVNKSPDFLMTLTGTGFTPGSTVVFGTVIEPRVTFVSATTLTVVIYSGYIPTAGTLQVKVRPGGGAADSTAVAFTVT